MLGAILAGGGSRRMGCPKHTLPLFGRSLLERVADRLRPQVGELVVVGDHDDWVATTPLTRLPDAVPGGKGPLAGLLAALDHASQGGMSHVLLVATDMPFLPMDLAERLLPQVDNVRPVVPLYEGRLQPVAALWPAGLAQKIRQGLQGPTEARFPQGSFRDLWAAVPPLEVPWPTEARDPFFNINTPEDLARAEALLAGTGKLA